MNNNAEKNIKASGLSRYLSPLSVWALAFGSAVGWGAFVMPGNTFLPMAGPLGTVIGIALGALLMILIGVNYAYMMKCYPDAGGAFSYTCMTFGHDHGFLNAWFLVLTYVAVVWANVTAIALIVRNVFGDVLMKGPHYTVFNYKVYLGEIALEIAVLVLCGLFCIYTKRFSGLLQTFCAVFLIVGIIVCAWMVFSKHGIEISNWKPGFAEDGKEGLGVLNIMLLAPWAFIGFESVSHSVEEFKFPVKKSFGIMTAAVLTGLVAYILPSLLAGYVRPEGYGDWKSYIFDIGNLSGTESMPVFYSLRESAGDAGLIFLGAVVLSGIITGIIGNMVAASRLLYKISEDRTLPVGFDRLSPAGTPKRAIVFIMIISAVIPFFGRTATGWVVDVTTVGAAMAYGYTSAAAYRQASKDGNTTVKLTGLIGIVSSILFCLVLLLPNIWSMSTLAAESYLILAVWSILGFLTFRFVFKHDDQNRFGKSTVTWLAILFLIFFTSLIWMRLGMHKRTEKLVNEISSYYTDEMIEVGVDRADVDLDEEKDYLEKQMVDASNALLTNSLIQFVLIIIALLIMFNVYKAMMKREKQLELEMLKAEEHSQAKSTFLSNMSHDIRTPMNAIIGYTNLAKREDITLPEVMDYLDKIDGSSQHLLALINDVLEMSRIESGKMELDLVDTDLRKLMNGMRDMFATQMGEKHIDYKVEYECVKHCTVRCDRNRLNRVLLNLISNAHKFTPENGSVTVSLKELDEIEGDKIEYELSVRDSGIGMSPEFAAKVFEAFEREQTSTVSGIQGTGLGMSITKSIVELMGGEISVETSRGKGTCFKIRLPFTVIDRVKEDEGTEHDQAEADSFEGMRLLVVEDIEMNREIAEVLLTEMGFEVESAENGLEAYSRIAAAKHGYFDAVLMDIQMPVMDGYEATRKIRELEDQKLSSIPIIAMTANAFVEDVKKAMDAGMNAHIAKPIDIEVLQDTLKNILINKAEV